MPRQWFASPFLLALLLPLGQSASIGVNLPGGGGVGDAHDCASIGLTQLFVGCQCFRGI